MNAGIRSLPRRPRLWPVLTLAVVASFPYLPFVPFSVLGNVNSAARLALVGISIVVLTGWVGQISLGHAGFVGVGAYIAGLAVAGMKIGFPVALLWGGVAGMIAAVILGVVALRVRGLYLAVATLLFSWMAEAFLFRHPFLAKYATIPAQASGTPNTFPYFPWSEDRRVFFYMAWAAVALAVFLMANLRDSKTGRAFFSVRGSEVAAASLGVDVVKTKLIAFAISGVIAGVAGGLMMAELGTVGPDMFKVDRSLLFLGIAVVGGLGSLGGSVAAGLVFAMLDEAFLRISFLEGYLEVVAAALLAGTLLLYRGGLAELPTALAPRLRPLRRRVVAPISRSLDALWERLISRFSRSEPRPASQERRKPSLLNRLSRGRFGAAEPVQAMEPLDLFTVGSASSNGNGHHHEEVIDVAQMAVDHVGSSETPASVESVMASATLDEAIDHAAGLASGSRDWRAMTLPVPPLPENRENRLPMIEAQEITVQFGGLRAVDDASLKVCEGEIVGLIGPNGAGKTTLFNSIAGLNVPTRGRVRIFGNDVTSWPVHKRAQLGVGRTFQAIQLFGQLSVFDNLMVATDRHNPTGLFAHLSVSRHSIEAERAARRQVERALDLLDLTSVADRRARDLPFGVLRMVELARALVTGARLIMLDEPASGLDNKETDRLADILRFVRSLGVTLLLIEHDVRMVTGVSDYMYVLDRGVMLAEGTPDHVQRDERVIAAYLGEQETAEVGA